MFVNTLKNHFEGITMTVDEVRSLRMDGVVLGLYNNKGSDLSILSTSPRRVILVTHHLLSRTLALSRGRQPRVETIPAAPDHQGWC